MTLAAPRSLYSLGLLYSEETYSTHSNLYLVNNGSLIVNAAQHKVLHNSLSCEAGEGVRV